jgi:hypothetical protein
VPFGEPRPLIVPNTPLGRSFTNNGDGSFWSGAYTARAFDARRGIWVEADVSVPLTGPGPSQEQIVAFFVVRDTLRWKTWDRVTGELIGVAGSQLRYPAPGGGAGTRDSVGLIASAVGDEVVRAMPRPVRDARPFHVVLQLLPDGRCAYAVDGRPLLASEPLGLGPQVQVLLAGNSQETRVLVGPLRVVTGVAPHVDWSTLGTLPHAP